ncbi:disintegrin and metalloproteinase domain-containing protein 12-like isoform X1 [Stegostoma tigrinum]|uniref:disintegrin and metalloproteinase domain-containing protein 12-like isoform X1 n=2 Tax=Stegostoma tigrinum TaxID=3053191 RepID=UPI0028701F74|nr:disintegrin and metalloproteinase domain-containing protein 12-like isoform X1 [Stegostoma tigrinum]XP_059506393.1 disintegrin and metalloproteinase domain-containing protein 12-like isoform X1 [Stegostoma tigrinum]
MDPIILFSLLCVVAKGDCCLLTMKSHSMHFHEIAIARKLTEPMGLWSQNITEWELQSDHENQVWYLLHFGARDHLLHLVKAQDLLTRTYSETHYLANGSMVTERRHHLNHCCYTGFVEGVEDSSASLCSCQGLSGYISIGDRRYAIDPVENSDEKHKLIQLGHVRTKRHIIPPFSTTSMSRKANLSIELFLVADREEFLQNGGDLRKTQERLITLGHHVNQIYYKELNIQIFLVGIEIWTTENKISSSQDTSRALLNFMKWRSKELVPRIRHDNAQLVSGMPFKESVGQAYLNAMCSEERSGGVVKDTWASIREVATYIAHEMGHNLGMLHDKPSCQCPVTSGKCLLAESAVWMMNPVFSNCSKVHLEHFLNHQNISCLMDQPNLSMNITVALVNDNVARHYKVSVAISVSLLFLIIAGLVMVIFQKQGELISATNPCHSSKILLPQNIV